MRVPTSLIDEKAPMPVTSSADFYQRYAPMIFRRCLAILGDNMEAQDAVQDVYLLLVNRLDSFRGESALTSWIYRTATNYCLNRLRAHRIESRSVNALCAVQVEQTEFGINSERAMLLKWLLDQFKPRTVQIVVYTYYDEMTQQEIAEVLGISERSVRKTLKRFREQANELVFNEEPIKES